MIGIETHKSIAEAFGWTWSEQPGGDAIKYTRGTASVSVEYSRHGSAVYATYYLDNALVATLDRWAHGKAETITEWFMTRPDVLSASEAPLATFRLVYGARLDIELNGSREIELYSSEFDMHPSDIVDVAARIPGGDYGVWANRIERKEIDRKGRARWVTV